MKTKISLFVCLLSLLIFKSVLACDLCSIFASTQASGKTGKGFYLGVAEQFTRFGTLQNNGQVVPNTVDQYLNSSITQMFLGYNVNSRVGVQLTVPFIHRSFRRPEGPVIQQGQVNGFGDSSLIGKVVALDKHSEDFTFLWDFLGGIKLPTGSSNFLREELFEEDAEEEGAVQSGIHGHDLTLGSGSVDGVVGSHLSTRWHRFLFNADLQYAIRSRGSFGYRFANDLQWYGGIGGFVLLNHTLTLAIQGRASGEHKGLDNLNGVPATDTGITSVYLGPEILFTWKGHLNVTTGADIPVLLDNTALQIVPDYKIRGSVTWRF